MNNPHLPDHAALAVAALLLAPAWECLRWAVWHARHYHHHEGRRA